MKFVNAQKEDLPNIYAQMVKNFIADEIRDYNDMERLFGHNYSIVHIVNNGCNVGFLGLWMVCDYTFLEHFVIFEQFRNKGLGGQALELLQSQSRHLLLETEPPIEEMAIRRLNFYLRHGMKLNKQDYYQPAYRPTGSPCYLKLMSYPNALSNFDKIASDIYNIVYGIDYEKRKYF